MKCKQNCRTKWGESVKAQKKDVNRKPMQNYKANHNEPAKTSKKEELYYSQHKQNYRADHDESIKAVNLLKR